SAAGAPTGPGGVCPNLLLISLHSVGSPFAAMFTCKLLGVLMTLEVVSRTHDVAAAWIKISHRIVQGPHVGHRLHGIQHLLSFGKALIGSVKLVQVAGLDGQLLAGRPLGAVAVLDARGNGGS